MLGTRRGDDCETLLSEFVFDKFTDLIRQFTEGFEKLFFDTGEIVGFGLGVLVTVGIARLTPLTGVDYIKAEVPGIITYLKQVGSFVKKGETIAEIINPLAEQQDDIIYPVRSSAEGILFSRNVDRFARPGRIMAKVAGTEPLREDNGNLLTL